MTTSCTKKAFTLIELLVVIAIIAIMAAILFPVFAKVREKARQATCASNEKQIGLALLSYVQDYDEVMPSCGYYNNPTGGASGDQWIATPATQLETYIKNDQVWICPSKGLGSPDPATTHKISYGFNYIGVFTEGPGVGCPSFNAACLSDLSEPSQTIAIAECGDGGPIFDNYLQLTSFPNDGFPGGGTDYRFQTQIIKHTENINCLFADGHVKSSLPSRLTWGEMYGVFGPNQTPLNQPCAVSGSWSSNCEDASGNYDGPNQYWGGPITPWTSPMASPAMDPMQTP